MITRKKRSLREKAVGRKTGLFQQLESKPSVSDVFCLATTELREALARARNAVNEAEQAMAHGNMPFQEAMESCKAATASACDAAINSAAAGETQARRKVQAVIENLQRISNSLADAKTL